MKGSEWNKWDLHIHSPMTWQANGYSDQCDIERYVHLLGEKQLSLVAVTNDQGRDCPSGSQYNRAGKCGIPP